MAGNFGISFTWHQTVHIIEYFAENLLDLVLALLVVGVDNKPTGKYDKQRKRTLTNLENSPHKPQKLPQNLPLECPDGPIKKLQIFHPIQPSRPDNLQ